MYYLEKGEPQYFDVIGASAVKKRADLNIETPDAVPLKKDCYVEIEVQAGMAYTREGQKASAKELGDYMIQLAQLGVLPQNVVTIFLQTMLETYNFGPTQEVMEAMKEVEGQGNLTDKQMDAIKLSVLEVLKDAGVVGPEAEERLVDSTKIGVVEALKDTGLIDKDNSGGLEEEKVEHEMQLKQESHEQKMDQGDQKMQIEKAKAMLDAEIKVRETQQAMQLKKQQTKQQMKNSEQFTKAQAKQMREGGNAAKKGK